MADSKHQPPIECPIASTDVAELARWLARARRWADAVDGCLAPLGLSQAPFGILWACSRAPSLGIAQSDLAIATGLSPAHISALVEQMRRKDWLRCDRAAQDRRRQLWQLTPLGREQFLGACQALETLLGATLPCSSTPRWKEGRAA